MGQGERDTTRGQLIRQLQGAYSGELAAGHAYRGHWRASRDPEERERIRAIEADEWHHREQVGTMLASLGAGPNPRREVFFGALGRLLGLLCHVSGWLAPMYGAGFLERHNVGEYEDAARFAIACGHDELVDALLTMAEVEWDHEAYFRGCVSRHLCRALIPLWPPLPPRSAIRAGCSRPEVVAVAGQPAPRAS